MSMCTFWSVKGMHDIHTPQAHVTTSLAYTGIDDPLLDQLLHGLWFMSLIHTGSKFKFSKKVWDNLCLVNFSPLFSQELVSLEWRCSC